MQILTLSTGLLNATKIWYTILQLVIKLDVDVDKDNMNFLSGEHIEAKSIKAFQLKNLKTSEKELKMNEYWISYKVHKHIQTNIQRKRWIIRLSLVPKCKHLI